MVNPEYFIIENFLTADACDMLIKHIPTNHSASIVDLNTPIEDKTKRDTQLTFLEPDSMVGMVYMYAAKKINKELKEKGVINDDVKVSELESMFKQVGGTHYMYMAIQPAEFINAKKLLFAEGNAIKYICRHQSKGKEEDVKKAIHYLEMIIERDYS